VDFRKEPLRAAEPEIAAKILVVGMRDGCLLAGTGDFIEGEKLIWLERVRL